MSPGNLGKHGGVLVIAFQNGSQDAFVEAVFGNGQGRRVTDVEDSGDGLFIQRVKGF